MMTHNEFADRWTLDPEIIFLNHGSFGATPKTVLEEQARIRRKMELEPLIFFDHLYLDELDRARRALAAFVGAQTDDLVFIVNATTGVNTVLRSLRSVPGSWWRRFHFRSRQRTKLSRRFSSGFPPIPASF
jgi:isopenicillin-N epimerase